MSDRVKQYWRSLLGALASGTKNAVTREALRRIASDYEQLARQVDGTAMPSHWAGASDLDEPEQRKRP